MKHHLLFGTAAALIAFLTFGSAQTAFAAIAAVDEKLFTSCMALESSEMKSDVECMGFFRRMNVVPEDMDRLRICRGMQPTLLTNDKECAILVAKHPDLVKFGSTPATTPGGAESARAND